MKRISGPLLGLAISLFLGLSACHRGNESLIEQNPTPIVESEPGDSRLVDERIPPTLKPPPLRFVIPTMGAEPVSNWRPPLYPSPWAISPYDHFYFARPIAADQVNWPLADYRYGGIFFSLNIHTGVDIDADMGTPVLATGPGTIVWAGWGLYLESHENLDDPYGLAVAIRHDFGYRNQSLFTIYAHMSEVDVTEGQWVDTGDLLGLVGSTGATTGPHLHFEVRLGENSFHHTYNPELWMAPPQGWGVLVGRLLDEYGKLLNHYSINVNSVSTGKQRTVLSYAGGATNNDPYYNENLVLSDLPEGLYKILLNFQGRDQQYWVTIHPGQVTYFTFKGETGFATDQPPTPGIELVLGTSVPTSTP
jgi:murein DD-endopeptidase MepM/ murein hydrolase activator NlpD